MKLTKHEILNLFLTQRVADDNTYVGKLKLRDYLNKCHLISSSDKNFINEQYDSAKTTNERESLEKIVSLLDGKVEKFSSDFWELFLFRKSSHLSDYDKKNFTQMVDRYEFPKAVNKKVNFLRQLKIGCDDLESFLTRIPYQQNGYIDYWFKLKKKNKDDTISDAMKRVVEKYGEIDNDHVKKAEMFSYFNQVDSLKELHKSLKGSEYQKYIEYFLEKHIQLEKEDIPLFNESPYHTVIYRKTIDVNINSLIYKFDESKEKVLLVANLITDFLNRSYIIIKKTQTRDNKMTLTLESYSENSLNDDIGYVKKTFLYLPELLLSQEYSKVVDEKNMSDDLCSCLKEYIKKASLYNEFESKFDKKTDEKIRLQIKKI